MNKYLAEIYIQPQYFLHVILLNSFV